MSSSKPVIMNVANTLKRRAQRGKGVTIEEMQRVAGEVLESHSTKLRDTMMAAIADSREMINHWRAGGDHKALVEKLTVMADEAQDQGRIYGNRLLAEVGARLSAFMSLLARAAKDAAPNAKAAIAIQLHLDAMMVAIDRPQHDKIDEAGQVLLSNLELTQRTIK